MNYIIFLKSNTGELLLTFFTLIAAGVPFLISWLEKRDKLKRTVYLIELIKTKEELIKIIDNQKASQNSAILQQKLENNLEEIEKEIYKSKKKFSLFGFLTIISIEIPIIFYFSASHFFNKGIGEGIFNKEIYQNILFLILLALSFIITLRIANVIRKKIKNKILYNVFVILVFNLILTLFIIFAYKSLEILDPRTQLF